MKTKAILSVIALSSYLLVGCNEDVLGAGGLSLIQDVFSLFLGN